MPTTVLQKANQVLKYLLLAGAGLYVIGYLVLACLRLPYPFELEWMEGGTVDHVRRVLAGRPLYVHPTVEFVPYIYTPLYFYLAAGLSSITGVGFLPLRLVSFLASLGCFAIIFLLVKRETGSAWAGALSAGLFAATYRLGGAWLDIARVDSLYLLLLLSGACLLRLGRSYGAWGAAGLLLALSFLTKQIALLTALPLALYALLANWRRGMAFVGTFAVLVGGSSILLDFLHQGWYSYYVFYLPARHELLPSMGVRFWTSDLFLALPIACLAAAGVLYVILFRRKGRPRFFYPLLAAGLVAGAWFSRLHYGGYDNVLLPAYLALALLFGLGIPCAVERVGRTKERHWLEAGLYLLGLVQFAALFYNPAAQVPTPADMAAGRRFLAALKEIPGDTWVPFHGYLPTLAGQESHAQWYAVSDVIRGDREGFGADLRREIQQTIAARRFAAIVLDDPGWFPEDMAAHYRLERDILDGEAFWPVTGPHVRPEWVYVPKDNSP